MLSNWLLEGARTAQRHTVFIRGLGLPRQNPDRGYVLYLHKYPKNMPYETYRQRRMEALNVSILNFLVKFPSVKQITGIASEGSSSPADPGTNDLMHFRSMDLESFDTRQIEESLRESGLTPDEDYLYYFGDTYGDFSAGSTSAHRIYGWLFPEDISALEQV